MSFLRKKTKHWRLWKLLFSLGALCTQKLGHQIDESVVYFSDPYFCCWLTFSELVTMSKLQWKQIWCEVIKDGFCCDKNSEVVSTQNLAQLPGSKNKKRIETTAEFGIWPWETSDCITRQMLRNFPTESHETRKLKSSWGSLVLSFSVKYRLELATSSLVFTGPIPAV